jgi:DNA-binding NtrC family response regulator
MKSDIEIVVVDKDERVVEALRGFVRFTAPKARVHGFTDAARARDFVMQNPVNLIITIHELPAIDGIRLAKAAPKSARKVMVTEGAMEIDAEEIKMLNVTMMMKPAPLRALAKIIAEEQAKA